MKKNTKHLLLSIKLLCSLVFISVATGEVLAREGFDFVQKRIFAQNELRSIEIIPEFKNSNDQDVEILDLSTGGGDMEQLESQLAQAQRVSIEDSLEPGESIVNEPYDPCPEFVGAGELGVYDKKALGRQRCEIKKLLKQEGIKTQVEQIMWNLTCTDPVGIVDKKRKFLETEQMEDLNKVLLWERSIKRSDKICKEADWSVLDPVFSVKSIGQAKFDSLLCKAALIEVRVINGIGAMGSWGFVLGLDACAGSNIGLSMNPEKVVFDSEAERLYGNLLKTISGWKGNDILLVNKVGELFKNPK